MQLHRILVGSLGLFGLAIACSRVPELSTAQHSQAAAVPDTNLIKLGEAILNDFRLSEPQGVACASCHSPGQAFTGNNGSSIPAVAAGSLPGRFGMRNSPTAMYAKYSPEFAFQPGENRTILGWSCGNSGRPGQGSFLKSQRDEQSIQGQRHG